MKKFYLIMLVFVFAASNVFAGTYSGGSGTSGDPYKISNTDDLIELSTTSGDWGAYFIQTADIAFNADETLVDWDGDGTLEHGAGGDDTYGFLMIGNSTTDFTGSYDGQNYTIDNFYINRSNTDYIGLFGYTNTGAEISNLELNNVYVDGYNYVGGMVGYNSNGTLSNSKSSGTVNGGLNYAGGLVGNNIKGTLSNCTSSCSVNGNYYVGGLAGWNSDFDGIAGQVTNCSSSGSVSGYKWVGGLVGINKDEVSNCSSSGSVEGTVLIGGLVGINDENSSISNSFSSGNVNGSSWYAGGLTSLNEGAISNSYSTGSVIGDKKVGGLVGQNGGLDGAGTINESYSTGSVQGTDNVGGLVGNNYDGTVNNSFWDTETSGLSISAGGTGKTTAEMKTTTTFSSWTFDANNWAISDGNSRPYLAWQDVAVDNGYPSSVGATSADFPAGNIRNDLATAITITYGYMYKQDEPPTWNNSTKIEVGTNVSISSGTDQSIATTTLNSLLSGTLYYVRSYATDGTTIWYGDVVCFKTMYSGGSGTSGDPYQIATTDDLIELSNTSTDLDKYFIQTADIAFNADETQVDWDGDGTLEHGAGGDDTYGFLMIGNSTTDFTGSYDGQNYSIEYIYINRPSDNEIGFFGDRVVGADIKNINLASVDITGGEKTGGLMGMNFYTSVDNCSVSGNVSGTGAVGGLIGLFNANTQSLSNCSNAAAVSNTGENTGGLIGSANVDNLTISNCHNTGNIDGTGNNVGGLIGHKAYNYLSISDSYNEGTITGDGDNIGGLIGYNETRYSDATHINNCYNTGNVGDADAGGFIGGLIGYNGYYNDLEKNTEPIENSYNTGDVEGQIKVGGLIGWNMGEIRNCYSIGNITAHENIAGGLAGVHRKGEIENSHYKSGTVTGVKYIGGLIGIIGNDIATSTIEISVSSSYSSGNVTGEEDVGGFVGWMNNISSTPQIINCYSRGNVTRTSGATATTFGGFVGNNNSYLEDGAIINNCYSTGNVSYDGAPNPTDKGFAGADTDNKCSNNFFDSELSNQNSDADGAATAKTTTEMKDVITFTDVSESDGLDDPWDFVGNPIDDSANNDYWDIDSNINNGYPFLPYQYTGPSNDSDNNLVLYIVESGGAPTMTFNNSAPESGDLPTGINHVSAYYWDITGPSSFSSAYVSVPIADLAGVDDQSTLVWLKRASSGVPWTDIGGTIVDGNLESDVFTSFSEFAIGSETGDNPLPVELQDFYAEVVHGGIELHWSTASEVNNAGFKVYRKDGDLPGFQNLEGLIEGAGTTSEPQDYSFTDKNVEPNVLYTYQIADIEEGTNKETLHPAITIMATKEGLESSDIPDKYALHANYPNPFNPTTTIEFDVPVGTYNYTSLRIYDSSGKLVKTLINEPMDAGKYSVSWHGKDDNGKAVSSGMYYCKMVTEEYSETKQLVLLK